MNTKPIFLGITLLYASSVSAGWFDFLDDATEAVPEETRSSIINTGSINKETLSNVLSNEEIANGLKQALDKGVTYAVDNLSKAGGFADNAAVRIPMPDKLKKVESMLRAAGQDKYADEFVDTMNQTAEAAVPLTLGILKDSVQNMTFDDAKQILNGSETAATEYLQRTGSDSLKNKISPIVKDATNKTGVTRIYKDMYKNLGFMGQFMNPEDYDIDGYITEQTMDGLFTMIAQEEKKIRDNPVERTTDLLKDVFGSIK
jgi:enhancing lycopene biosynthesis protein 2